MYAQRIKVSKKELRMPRIDNCVLPDATFCWIIRSGNVYSASNLMEEEETLFAPYLPDEGILC